VVATWYQLLKNENGLNFMFVLWFKLANWVHLPAVRADAGLGRKIWVER